MKHHYVHSIRRSIMLLLFSAAVFTGCSSGPQAQKLSANEFADKIRQLPSAPLLDVRTPEEFADGHLTNARNFDWNGDSFEQQTATLDKASPVFVYCLSGGRSAEAAQQMRTEGFKQVYELKGGIMKWRAAGLPETAGKENTAGMSMQQFDTLLESPLPVLVDVYAEWCMPCKKMKPALDSITAEMKDKVKVIRINADENKALCKVLHIESLPVLQLYKEHTLSWSHEGYLDRESITEQLK